MRVEFELLQLTAFANVPAANGVVETARPRVQTVRGEIDAARAIGMALELSRNRSDRRAARRVLRARRVSLPNNSLILYVPHENVAIGTATEAELAIGRYGESVAGRRLRLQLAFQSSQRRRAR